MCPEQVYTLNYEVHEPEPKPYLQYPSIVSQALPWWSMQRKKQKRNQAVTTQNPRKTKGDHWLWLAYLGLNHFISADKASPIE